MPFLPGNLHHNYAHGQRLKNKTSGAYKTWLSMIGRCNPKNSESRPLYAGSGVSVCEKWKNFEGFFSDMGPRPKGCSIDRIDPSKGYEPGNCRWATNKQQAANRKTTNYVVIRGKKMMLKDASDFYQIPMSTIFRRYKDGLRGEDLISRVNRNRLRVGERSSNNKLSENDVIKVKQMLREGVKNCQIAKKFGVSSSVISEIKNHKAWAHVVEKNNDTEKLYQ